MKVLVVLSPNCRKPHAVTFDPQLERERFTAQHARLKEGRGRVAAGELRMVLNVDEDVPYRARREAIRIFRLRTQALRGRPHGMKLPRAGEPWHLRGVPAEIRGDRT